MTRRIQRGDDRGASLVIALLFVTVVAMIVAVLLSLVDTNLRTTNRLHEQAYATANADGAAQIAINDLRKGSFDGTTGTCFTGGDNLPLFNFNQAPGGAADSAFVTCGTDTVNSVAHCSLGISSGNKPGNAILTLGTSPSEDGIKLNTSATGDIVRVHGGIFSNSNINIVKGTLETNAYVKARTTCTPGKITSVPMPPSCDLGGAADSAGNDPLYPLPTAAATPRTVPPCTNDGDVITFQPGLYDSGDIDELRALTRSSGCKNATFWFPPGTYYFDFPQNKPWIIDTGYVVGGKAKTPFVNGGTPTIPGACMAPIPPSDGSPWTNPGPNAGVQFVLGGATQIQLSHGQFELCGTYSATSPPLAIYGMRAGGGAVPVQSGCTTAMNASKCATIQSDNSPSSKFFVQGTTYVPKGWLDVALNNTTGQVFRYGVVARALSLNPTGSANLSQPVIEVPDDTPSGGLRTVVYLKVYVCPGSATCSATGKHRLTVKVGVIDPTGTPTPPNRQVMVYTWSVVR